MVIIVELAPQYIPQSGLRLRSVHHPSLTEGGQRHHERNENPERLSAVFSKRSGSLVQLASNFFAGIAPACHCDPESE